MAHGAVRVQALRSLPVLATHVSKPASAAWAEGVGERLTQLYPPEAPEESNYLILKPNVGVATADVFKDPELTRNSVPITIHGFLKTGGRNDCLGVVRRRYPEVARAFDWLSNFYADLASFVIRHRMIMLLVYLGLLGSAHRCLGSVISLARLQAVWLFLFQRDLQRVVFALTLQVLRGKSQ